mgnify:CR=1 FL=1
MRGLRDFLYLQATVLPDKTPKYLVMKERTGRSLPVPGGRAVFETNLQRPQDIRTANKDQTQRQTEPTLQFF